MSMQEFVVGPDERMCLAMLRGKHRELGFNGPCVVKFAPCHFLAVLGLPGFVRIHQYIDTKPEDPLEVGAVELFQLISTRPLDYAADGIW